MALRIVTIVSDPATKHQQSVYLNYENLNVMLADINVFLSAALSVGIRGMTPPPQTPQQSSVTEIDKQINELLDRRTKLTNPPS